MGASQRQMSRFIVPFFFPAGEYDTRVKKVGQQTQSGRKEPRDPLWRRLEFEDNENEFFPLIKDGLKPKSSCGIGALWELKGLNDPRLKKKLFYRLDQGTENPAWIRCKFSNAGLALFKTGVGLVWFELSLSLCPAFPSESGAMEPTPRQVTEVNNYCKDICHRNTSSGRRPLRLFPGPVYAGETPPTEKDVHQDFSIFEWLYPFLLQELKPVSFFSERKQKNENATLPQIGPDKAHVFAALYLSSALDQQEQGKILYWLRRGYRPSYLPSQSDLDGEQSIQLFENFTVSVCFEGCAFLAHETGLPSTDRVFSDHLMTSMLRDQFILYLLSLQQYYTLLRLSARMAQLPDQTRDFGPKEFQQLLTLREDLGLANTRSFFTQVSYIGHQNRVYEEYRRRLNIPLLQEELTKKTETLAELIEDYRERRRDRYGRNLTVIGGIFVVLQTVSTLSGLYDMVPALAPLGRWGFSASVLAASCVLGVALTWLWKRRE